MQKNAVKFQYDPILKLKYTDLIFVIYQLIQSRDTCESSQIFLG